MAETTLETVAAQLTVLGLEARAGFAEQRLATSELRDQVLQTTGALRAELSGLRQDVNLLREETTARFTTLIDAISDLRNEYAAHWHGPEDNPEAA